MAYVNGQGLRALGVITDPVVRPGEGIFIDERGKQRSGEYHVTVQWLCVLEAGKALSHREAASAGYHLPIRNVFSCLPRGKLATWIERAVLRRADNSATQ